jgi:hypothetical protein
MNHFLPSPFINIDLIRDCFAMVATGRLVIGPKNLFSVDTVDGDGPALGVYRDWSG